MRFKEKLLLLLSIFLIFSCKQNESLSFLEGSGIIETTNIFIGSQVSSKVLKIVKYEGDKISKGDTIIVLDYETYNLQLNQAEAMVSLAKAQLDLILSGAREEDINQAKEFLNQAQIKLNQAEENLARMENLYKSKTITQKQYEDAVHSCDLAKSIFVQARENYNKIVSGPRPEEISQARANLKKAEASFSIAKKQFGDCFVTSPEDGYILEIFFEQGETVPMFSTLCKVSDLSSVNLIIYIPETVLGKIKLNQTADIFTDTFKDKVFKGRVSQISSEAEFTPKNIQTKDERTRLVYAIKIEIPNPDSELKDGMPADAKINIEQNK